MTKECTLKELFITSKLDEIQPDWRTGADVTQETKDKIRQRVFEKYSDLLEDAECISIRSIESTITRIRDKLNIPHKSDIIKNELSKSRTYMRPLDSSAPKPEPSSEIQATVEPGEPVEPHEPSEPSKEPEEESEPSALEIIQSIANQEIQQEPEGKQESEEEQEPTPAQVASEPPESIPESKPESESEEKVNPPQATHKESEEEVEKAAKEHNRDAVIAKLKQEEAKLNAELEQPIEEDKPVKEGEYPPDCYFYCLGCHESFKIGNNTKCPLCGSEKIVENDLLNKCDYKPKPLKKKLLFCPGGCGFGIDPVNKKWYSKEETS